MWAIGKSKAASRRNHPQTCKHIGAYRRGYHQSAF
jgi:hypothetical protein